MNMDLYRNAFVIAVAALFSLALYWMLAPFWGALAWGIGLAFLLSPLQCWLTRKLNGRANLAAGMHHVLVPVVLTGPLLSLGVAFVHQFADLVTRLQQQPLRFNASLLSQYWNRTPSSAAWPSGCARTSPPAPNNSRAG
jgi:predicted PurR-regulated permease PerM